MPATNMLLLLSGLRLGLAARHFTHARLKSKQVRRPSKNCLAEKFANAIHHSNDLHMVVRVINTAAETKISIFDDGVGVFKMIQHVLGLVDKRH
jgi:hypothetical protein